MAFRLDESLADFWGMGCKRGSGWHKKKIKEEEEWWVPRGSGAKPLGGLFAEGVCVDVAAHHTGVKQVEAGFEIDVGIKDMIDQEIFVFLDGA